MLQQGRIRLVLTGALHSDSPIAAHQHKHGDGVKVIALSVPDVDHAYREATTRGAEGVTEPHDITDEHGTVRLAYDRAPTARRCTRSSSATATRARSSPASGLSRTRTEDSGMLLAIDHIVGNVELGAMDAWVKYYEDVFGMTEMIHFSDDDIATEYSALMSQGRDRRQGPREVPDQRARRGQAQVADRRVPRVLRGRRARSTSPSPRATSSAPSPRCAAAASSSSRSRPPTTRTSPSASPEIEGQLDDLKRAGHPRRPRRRGLPAADLHAAARRPADDVLRDHRAPRRARLRRRQLQGAVRGASSASRRSEGTCRPCAT